MLQRLVEDFEYSELLDKAAQCSDSCEQLAYVAAFTVSAYATTSIRTAKPFNPLLGETFEFDRTDDLGWKVLYAKNIVDSERRIERIFFNGVYRFCERRWFPNKYRTIHRWWHSFAKDEDGAVGKSLPCRRNSEANIFK